MIKMWRLLWWLVEYKKQEYTEQHISNLVESEAYIYTIWSQDKNHNFDY